MIQFGSLRTFAIRLLPLEGAPDESDPAARATWVALELWAERRNLSSHTHEADQTVHEGLHWPAVYLARWLVRSWHGFYEQARWPVPTPHFARTPREVLASWDRKIAEYDPPDHELDARDEFVATHFLEAGAGGGLVPGVCLSREQDKIVVSWNNLTAGSADVSFHRSFGEVSVDAREFAETVQRFVDWVRDRVPADSSDARELGSWLDAFEAPVTAWRMVRSFAGLDDERLARLAQRVKSPAKLFGLDEAWASAGTLARPELSPIAVAFRSTSPTIEPDELLSLRATILKLPRVDGAFASLEALSRRIPGGGGPLSDYEQGYLLATALRSELGNAADPLDVEDLVKRLGIPVVDVQLSDPTLDGGAVCNDTHGPAIFVNRESPRAAVSWGRRMIFAHELAHLLFDRHGAVPLAVISGPWAPARLERRANAFAAELLLPKAALERLARKYVDDELLEQARLQFGVGYQMASWHITNRLI